MPKGSILNIVMRFKTKLYELKSSWNSRTFNTMKPEALQSNPTAAFVEQFINQTSQSIFLTGKAGTGKTTLLRKTLELGLCNQVKS